MLPAISAAAGGRQRSAMLSRKAADQHAEALPSLHAACQLTASPDCHPHAYSRSQTQLAGTEELHQLTMGIGEAGRVP